MSYLHIENLYKNRDIMLFRECYALEKIHGESWHIRFADEKLTFFAPCLKPENIPTIFNHDELLKKFTELRATEKIAEEYPITVYGEGYGGKIQARSKTYGKQMKFIVFEVRIGKRWLSVPDAESIAKMLGLEFVHYNKIPTTLEAMDIEMLAPSVQAMRNGVGDGLKREGVVLRPLIELTKNNDGRIISKHKRGDFQETKTPRDPKMIDPEKLEVLEAADKIAEEWVTPIRLEHVLQKIAEPHDLTKCGEVTKSMVEDVLREATGEIVDSKDARKAIAKRAVSIYKEKVMKI